MLRRSASALEKWKGFDKAIDRWLDERHHLIIQLTDFAADHDFKESTPEVEEKLKAFASLLIDYISAGHFEIYNRLIEEGEEFDDTEALLNTAPLLESIDQSTEEALKFNEKYDDLANLSSCANDLSLLAEALAVRFDAEDQMINSLHDAHLRQIDA